jgi:hypothetical protein
MTRRRFRDLIQALEVSHRAKLPQYLRSLCARTPGRRGAQAFSQRLLCASFASSRLGSEDLPYVWIIDPADRKAWRCTADGMYEVSELRTENPDTLIPLTELFDEP